MKKISFLFLLGSIVFSSYAQNAGNCIQLTGSEFPSGGDNPHFEAANNSTFDLTKQVTVEAWVKLSNPQINQKIAGKTTVAFTGGYMLGIDDGGLYPEVWDADGNNYTFFAGTIPANEWTHVAITWEGGGTYCGYVNGVKVYEEALPNNNIGTNPNPFIIGAAPWDQQYFGTNGYVDEIRLWSEALDSVEINQWMHKEISDSHPHYANLICNYRFNESTSYSLSDAGPNGNDAIGSTSDLENYWTVANYPLASNTNCMNDVEGIWEVWTDNQSDELSIADSDISDENGIAFGNNGMDLSFSSEDIPAGVSLRTQKMWNVENITDVSSDWVFDISALDLTGVDTLYMIGSTDSLFATTDTILKGIVSGDEYLISDFTIEDGITFYCLAAWVEGLNPEDVFNEAMTNSMLDLSPETQTIDPTVSDAEVDIERMFAAFGVGMPEGYLYDLRFVFSEQLPANATVEVLIGDVSYPFELTSPDANFWLSELMAVSRWDLSEFSGLHDTIYLSVSGLPEGTYQLEAFNVVCESVGEFPVPSLWNVFGSDTITIISDIETGVEGLNMSGTEVYPNPVENILYVDGCDVSRIEILDVRGVCVGSFTNTNTIDVSGLKKGVYILRILDGKNWKNAKICVE